MTATSIQAETYTLNAINTMDAHTFASAFGKVYEHSPWIAQRAFDARPAAGFATLSALHGALVATVGSASLDEQSILLRAHPELAGVEAAAGALTNESTHEQQAAGLNALSVDEVRRLRVLNARYRERFGFPFIIAARNNTKAAIYGTLEARLHNTSDMELRNALAQVGEIARLRLTAMTADG
jgi:2-oxo-4-hydroxy-4-carboxy-5-ureidoimidazoline decarboxylase